MIRIHALHQRSAGTNALVVLKDTRWEDSRQIIGTMEVDLLVGTQLVYMFLDMVLSIDEVLQRLYGKFDNKLMDMVHGKEGDEFSDNEATSGKVTIIEEKEGWDDDERSRGKILQESEKEWENPFAAKREHVFPTAADDAESSISYQPPPDVIMGPAVYPPAKQNPQPTYKPDHQFGYPQGKGNTFYGGYGEYHNSQWTLPPTWTESGVMLVLPADPGLWSDLVVKSGKLHFPSTIEKLFAKLPPSLSKKIEESFKAKHPGLNVGVLPAIKFTHTFVPEMFKDAALAKELRDLSLCFAIPIPGYYKNNKKKYGIRKSRMYKGKPHNSHVKPLKRKYKDERGRVKKCKCFICGKERHFAKDCRTDFDDNSVYSILVGEGDVHQNISVMVQDTPFEEAAFMVIEGINESDDEQSIEEDYYSHHAFMFHPGAPTKIADMAQSAGSWKPNKELPTQSKSYDHDWKERNYLGKTTNIKGKQPHKPEEEKDFSSNEVRLLKELLKENTKQLKTEQIIIEEQKDEEIRKLKAQPQKEREKEAEIRYSSEEFPPLGNSQIARPFMEAEVESEIHNCPMFGTTAIIDTRASACCINKKVIPEDALEPLTQTVFFNDLNSRQQATHRIKQGSFLIEGNKFKIPLIYAFDMNDSNGIEMLIGANFLRPMKGGIRIEGDEITIYKKVTRIKTSNQTTVAKIAITELEVSEEEFMEINESIYFNQEGNKAFLEHFKPVIERLKDQGYIGEEPLKHWKKNGELCKLDIINPDIIIEDRPLKHVTPIMEDSFKKHVDGLLKIGAIRPSKSRHRTMAMIINSGTTIDPATGKEIKGKERMVFNYKSLNDNTYKDQCSLPG
ncbi:Orf y, partial [Tanacetum coccineum]